MTAGGIVNYDQLRCALVLSDDVMVRNIVGHTRNCLIHFVDFFHDYLVELILDHGIVGLEYGWTLPETI